MKITFEGTLREILDDMIQMMEALDMLADMNGMRALPATPAADPGPVPVQKVNVPKVDVPVVKPPIMDKPMDKPKRERTEKQLANDEKLRIAAREKMAAKKAAKAERPSEPMKKLVEEFVKEQVEEPQPEPFAEPTDPAEIVKLRTRTIEELQAAYADGHQKEVFELLSRFGNGAKSFRELPPEAFPPIRKAIDLGALE